MGQFKLLIVDDEQDLVAMVERIYKKAGLSHLWRYRRDKGG